MLLLELFDNTPGGDEEGGVVRELRNDILDMLTPLAANGVPFITIQAIIDKMSEQRSGVAIDRALVMHVLDPADVKMINKIEGDRVYFSLSDDDESEKGEDAEAKDEAKVSSMAMKSAKDNIKKKNGVAPAPEAPSSVAPAPAQGGGGPF
ncbi:MAG: hypothetical protein EOP83_25010 [Verrucomicrobiaceae bacterium]|nr:MAG: hypothetical protein EOP83_25010 [Verrucomicrobiaceae bacterium]